MGRKTPVSSLKRISEINLTPLMDLTFILLITFIITFPLIEQGIPVHLPKASAEQVTPDDARSVTLDRSGHVYLDDAPVSVKQLVSMLSDAREGSPNLAVMVRADEQIAYGKVVVVLKALHDAKITKMALVTEAESQ